MPNNNNPACHHTGRCHAEYHPGYWLEQQRRFMAERGNNLSGYLAFYRDTDPDQVRAIYEADRATLWRYASEAQREVTTRRRR